MVNLSLCSTKDSESGWRTDTALAQVIERATQSATVVAAAGNLEYNSSSVSFYPAAYSGVVGVMAQGADGYHDTTNYGTAYDIFAPGEGILVSTENGVYRTEGECTSGTSMASPIVSFAAALLRLSLTAEQLSGGDELPRTSVITRMITGLSSDDGTVDAPDGKAYKKLDMMKLVSEDIDDIDYGWLPVTGIGITATRAGRDVSSGASVTVQTLRETGAGRSYLEFSAVLTPAGDTDPSVAEQVQWTLVEYETKDGKETEVATHDLGTGATIGHLFDTAGSFGVRASIKVPTAVDPFVAEFRLTVSHPRLERQSGIRRHLRLHRVGRLHQWHGRRGHGGHGSLWQRFLRFPHRHHGGGRGVRHRQLVCQRRHRGHGQDFRLHALRRTRAGA